MTYEVQKRILHIGVYEKVKLTRMEHLVLICLSSNEVTSIDEIRRYLKLNSTGVVYVMMKRLKEKSKYELRIKTIRGVGYYLEDDLWIK